MMIECLHYVLENVEDNNNITYLSIKDGNLVADTLFVKSGDDLPQIKILNWPTDLIQYRQQIINDYLRNT